METALSDIGFAEFTTQLVVDVFDGLVSQNIRQMQAYQDLVEALAKTDDVYVDESYDDVDATQIDALLAKALPDPDSAGDTLVVEGKALTRAQVSTLNTALELSEDDGGLTSTIDGDSTMSMADNQVKLSSTSSSESGSSSTTDDSTTALTLTSAEVETIREAAARRVASKQITSLREMAKMGLMRLVVDSGTIETRLTFSMTTSSESTSTSTSTNVNASSASATATWMKVSASASTSKVKVRTATTYNQDKSGSTIEVFGSVKINFKTDYVPLSS